MQTTASGGVHLIYRGIIKTTVGVLGDGIDTRGVGGMIVAAPSAGYRMHDVAELGDVLEPADLPQWIADLAGGTSNKPDDADQEPAVELDSPDAITWAIDYLKHHALPAIEGRHGEKTLLMVAGRSRITVSVRPCRSIYSSTITTPAVSRPGMLAKARRRTAST